MIYTSRSHYPGLPVERACALLGVSRHLYYRALPAPEADVPAPPDMAWRDAMERIVLEFPGYGYRRVTAQLRREGWTINHKRVLRLMRTQGWLCRLHRRWIKTTQSAHGLRRYPNLIKAMVIERLDQVWVADLTYIRLPQGFAYLATILDAFSRKAIGWHLSRQLDASLVLAALEQALQARQPPPGFIHHSDQGVQYACGDYVSRLLAAGGQVSMAAKGCPRENAQAESFFRTLKVEEVDLQEYHDLADADAGLAHFIEAVYNQKRLHSALGYMPPTEFEENVLAALRT